MDFTYTFHGVTHRPTLYGPKDNSSKIALEFGENSRQTSQLLSKASRELREAVQDLALAVGEGRTFKEIGDCQERYLSAVREFDGLHRKWVTQATSARNVLRDYMASDQEQD